MCVHLFFLENGKENIWKSHQKFRRVVDFFKKQKMQMNGIGFFLNFYFCLWSALFRVVFEAIVIIVLLIIFSSIKMSRSEFGNAS